MKNSKFTFKRAIALVICLCMVVTSLVFAPVVSAETEIANTNTQEFQKFDFDTVNPVKVSNQNGFFSKVTEEDGNVAIGGTNKSSGTVGYYMQLDHTLEVGKKYIVTLDFKGTGRFWVALCNDLTWKNVTGIPDNSAEGYTSPDGYTRYKLEMTTATTVEFNSIVFLAEGNSSIEGTEFWFDNVTIVERDNTQELQKYDFDYINFANRKTEGGYTKDAKDGDNTAIKLNIPTSGNSAFYGDLDFDLEQGKKYKVSFDLKGIGYFYVAFSNAYGWGTLKYLPNGNMKGYQSPDGYTRYEVEMTSATDTTNTFVSLLFLTYAVNDTSSAYYQGECYIDNITISEESAVAIGTIENGTASLDKTAYYYGDTATLTATPDAGYVFAGWVDAEGNAVADTMKYTFEVAAPVTLTPVFEKAEANTAEYQKYDLDGVDFVKTAKEGKASVADDGTGNKAIKIEKFDGASHFYAQTEYPFKAGKRYTISMDVKGVNRFIFNLASNCGWTSTISTIGIPNNNEKTYKSDDYTTITFDTGVLTTDIYNSIYFKSYAAPDWEGHTVVGDVGYIDNIVIKEHPNTQEKQSYNFDDINFANSKKENGFTIGAKDGDNTALKLKISATNNSAFYGDLDFDLEQGKKYKVAFDLKGKGRFYVAFSNSYGWGSNFAYAPSNVMKTYSSPDEYSRYEVEMTSAAATDTTFVSFMLMSYAVSDTSSDYYEAECYIDNITITEEVNVTVGTAENGSTSADGKTIFYGDTVELTATADPAYKFVKWVDENGAEVSLANPYVFEAEDGINLTPVFEAYEATEYVRDFDNEEYNTMAPIVGNNGASVEYVYNETLGKTVAKITLKNDNSKIAIPFVPEDGKDYRLKIKYLYNGTWFCTYYNGEVKGSEGPHSGTANKWVEQDWYFTQSGDDFFYLFTTNLKGAECVIFIDSITFIESTKGDLNNDDAIDAVDITLLRKFLMGDNSNDIDLSAANVSQINDEDKIEVDVKDLVALKKKIVSNK